MTADAKHLVDDFEKLSDLEKREVLSELLHAAKQLDYPLVTEDELTSAANEVFLEYDRWETSE